MRCSLVYLVDFSVVTPQAIIACPLDLTLLEIRYHGGTVSEVLDEAVSHVVVDERWACIGVYLHCTHSPPTPQSTLLPPPPPPRTVT